MPLFKELEATAGAFSFFGLRISRLGRFWPLAMVASCEGFAIGIGDEKTETPRAGLHGAPAYFAQTELKSAQVFEMVG